MPVELAAPDGRLNCYPEGHFLNSPNPALPLNGSLEMRQTLSDPGPRSRKIL